MPDNQQDLDRATKTMVDASVAEKNERNTAAGMNSGDRTSARADMYGRTMQQAAQDRQQIQKKMGALSTTMTPVKK